MPDPSLWLLTRIVPAWMLCPRPYGAGADPAGTRLAPGMDHLAE